MLICFMAANQSTVFPWPQRLVQRWTYKQSGPIRVFIVIHIGTLRKRSPTSISIAKLRGCDSNVMCGHRINLAKRTLLKLIQEEGWREGTTLASSLEHWLHYPRLAWSHPENPPLDRGLVMRTIQNQFHLLLTWFELDFCLLQLKETFFKTLTRCQAISQTPFCLYLS